MVADDNDYELARIRFKKLYNKAKELNLKDEDIRNLEILQKYKEKRLDIISLTFKYLMYAIFFTSVISLATYGAVRFNYLEAKTVAKWTTIFTGVDLETDQCIFPFTESVLDLMRPPVNCSFCKGVTGFERVSNLSQKSFVNDYAYSGRPVIITDATQNWTALKTFNFDFIKSIYKKDSVIFNGNDKGCQFFPYQTKFEGLGDVFAMSKKMKEMRSDPWYIGW